MIRPARASDVPAIEELVDAAYEKYVARIGMRPLPMDDDYRERVERGEVYVTGESAIDGVLVLVEHEDHLMIDNVAVAPRLQGRGIGRRLLSFAEESARAFGLRELRLYTNVKMIENRALYARLGYDEIEEIEIEGRQGVLMRKRLD